MTRRRTLRLLFGPGFWLVAMGCLGYAYRLGAPISFWQWIVFVALGIVILGRALEDE